MTFETSDLPDSLDYSLPVRRLRKNSVSLINAQAEMEILCVDRFVTGLATGLGLDADKLVILRVLVRTTPVTLVIVPDALWHGPADHARLLELKDTASFADHRCVLVPEGYIQRQPRLSNARLIESSLTKQVTADQRLRLLAFLIEAGPSSLAQCACEIGHPDPASAILQLSAAGIVTVDVRAHIGPGTLVDLPSPKLAG
jgi:hypothetical protein